MVSVYHTICANCDTQYHLIAESDKDSTRCNDCGVYLYDSYDEVCDYLDGGGIDGIICELCEEFDMFIQNEIKHETKNCNICNKKNIINAA